MAKRKLSAAELQQRRRVGFQPIRGGLRARTQVGNQYRSRKEGHYLRKVLAIAAEANRPLDALQLPAARRWCRSASTTAACAGLS